MADRKSEKEARRQARLEQQEAERKQQARRKAMGRIGGIVLGLAAVGVVIVLLLAGGDDDGASAADSGQLREAAAAAGCEFRQLDSEGRDHVEEAVQAADYSSNPPTSGPHNPVAAQDGFYQPGNEPALGNWIHSLEHGRILFQYKPGTGQQQIQQLRGLAEEELNDTAGYHTLVFQNNTDMPKRFAAVGWTRYVACDELNEQTLGVFRDFRRIYTDQAPELIP